jgi:tetratricopeptide (TPR) repeat protein
MCLATGGSRALAQEAATPDEVAGALGLTSDEGALPVWSAPSADARQDLADVVRSAEHGVLLVGQPGSGRGTAWVISRQHRLLATNAHVADLLHQSGKMLAVVNGTSQVHTVQRAWYHPGVRRIVAGVPVRTDDPAKGTVSATSPDVAVLQLAEDGPDLPFEFAMATPEELADPLAQPVAMIGFPGVDTASWPALGDQALATYHDGVISRLSDFALGGHEPLQFLQHTMSAWTGFSGSPIFLANGHVIGLHNSARIAQDGDHVQRIPHGIRVDCLWELLAFHKLTDLVPIPVEASSLHVERWLEPDPQLEKIAEAEALLDKAEWLTFTQEEYKEAVDRCIEAWRLMPGYARVYSIRASAYNGYAVDYKDQVGEEAAFKYLTYARADAEKCIQLAPSDLNHYLTLCYVLGNMGDYFDHTDYEVKAMSILDQVMSSDNLPDRQRASALSCRAGLWANVDDNDRALADYNAALRLAPDVANFWDNRAGFWNHLGYYDEAAADRAKADELRAKQRERR